MSTLCISLDLSPLPAPREDTLRFGLHVFGAAVTAADAGPRITALRTALAGKFPESAVDANGFIPWADVEKAFAQHWGEFLPWLWSARDVSLQVGNKLVAVTQIMADSIQADSLTMARRGFLKTIYSGSGLLELPAKFARDELAESGTKFNFGVLSLQATRWPAPIPQEALRTVMVLEVARVDVESALQGQPDGACIAATLGFTVEGRSYPLPGVLAMTGDELAWESGAATEPVKFESAGVPAKAMLEPPLNDESFLHPASSLWLRNALKKKPKFDDDEVGPGATMADHDWWSRLHDGVAAAAELPRLLIEAMRQSLGQLSSPDDVARAHWALIVSLRDLLAPGIASTGTLPVRMYPHQRSPLMLSLLSLWRAADKQASGTLDLFAIGRDNAWEQALASGLPADDFGRVGLVYAVLDSETQRPPTRRDWYCEFRTLSPDLQMRLPELPTIGSGTEEEAIKALGDTLQLLSPDERIDRAEFLRTESMRPAVRMIALLKSWNQSVELVNGDSTELQHAKAAGKKFLENLRLIPEVGTYFAEHDPLALYLATAALDVASRASSPRPGDDPQARFASRIARAVLEHASNRMGANSVFRPPLLATAALFPKIDAAAATLAEPAHRAIFKRDGVDMTGQPSSIVLQVDTLNGNSDQQAGETDLNDWLMGNAAFWRRATPQAASTPWGCGQLGVVEMQMWESEPLLKGKDGKPLLALAPVAASTNYGVRQVLLQHDNRPLLPERDIDMVGQSDAGGQADGWANARAFVVVTDRNDVSGAGALARLPFVAYGIDYEAIVFAQGRSGVLPGGIAGRYKDTAPYLVDMTVDLDGLPKAEWVRTLSYRRRVPVSAPRVRYDEPNPNRKDRRLPADWNASNVSRHLSLAHEAWADGQESDAKPVFVILSKAGLAPAEAIPAEWQDVSFSLMPPSCTWALYDRWTGYDQANADAGKKDRWALWRRRIHASELLLSAWKNPKLSKADQKKFAEIAEQPGAQLDDPAVSAVLVRWAPLRSHHNGIESIVVPLQRPRNPPAPNDANADDSRIVLDRGQAGPPDWQVRVLTFETGQAGRFEIDVANHLIKVRLWPGEIGDLDIASAVLMQDLQQRCHLEPSGVVTDGQIEYGLFASWSARFEVATAHALSPATLHGLCSAQVQANDAIQLRWNRHDVPLNLALEPGLLEIDNVATVKAIWQVWHGTGRPLPTFPHDINDLDSMKPLQTLEDGTPDPSASGVIWDAQGFAERMASSARETGQVKVGIGTPYVILHEDRATGRDAPRYSRYAVEATHRYADLYIPLLSDASNRARFAPVRGRQEIVVRVSGEDLRLRDEWIRAFRPGADPSNVPRPPVRMVVPLTRSLERRGAGHGADLLVVVDEELNTTSALATRLEAMIEPVHRDFTTGSEWMLERAPDPIVTGARQAGTLLAIDCLGPLGHTFDTDTREPRFTGVSYLVQAGGLVGDWEFAKLSFRRWMAPELMAGYYPAPSSGGPGVRIGTTPVSAPLALTYQDLERFWQGHATLQCLRTQNATTSIDIGFFGNSMRLGLDRKPASDGNGGTWSLSCAALPVDAFLHTDLRVVQDFNDSPSTRLQLPDFRIIAARILEPSKQPPKPARWEVSGYLAVARRPEATAAESSRPPWEKRWMRVLTWQLDEPDDASAVADAPAISLTADVPAIHGCAQAVLRASDYTPADWIQALPEASLLPVAGQPWIERHQGETLTLSIDQTKPGQVELAILQAGRLATLHWQDQPVVSGGEGQGLHHRLLVTRVVPTADGNESEAYYGLFHQKAKRNLFVPLEPVASTVAFVSGTRLRAYVLLVQQSLRTEYATPSIGFWDSIFPSQSDDPRQTSDARLRILAIGEQIGGAAP